MEMVFEGRRRHGVCCYSFSVNRSGFTKKSSLFKHESRSFSSRVRGMSGLLAAVNAFSFAGMDVLSGVCHTRARSKTMDPVSSLNHIWLHPSISA